MKNLNFLNLDTPIAEAIDRTNSQYLRHIGVGCEVISYDGTHATIRVKQYEASTRSLSTTELIEKGKEIFSHAPDIIIRWRPAAYESDELDAVSPTWVRNQLKRRNEYQRQLVKDLGLDEQVISKLLNGHYEMTRWHKAAFYYYFKYREVAEK